MSARSKQVLAEVLTWPEEDRAELATELLASLEGPADEGVEAAWAEEIERRARDALAGRGETYDLRESLDRIEAKLRTRTTP